MLRLLKILTFLFVVSLIFIEANAQDKTLFELVDPGYSNVLFNNQIEVDIRTKNNIFDFDYFYNGAGVGAADLNNDGLTDLVFNANQKENRIYINEGSLKFKDITATAGINQNKGWSNGITFVDINGDGWLDIYVCQGGPLPEEQRKNLLFINQKDLTFTEEAEAYGLADNAISNQAVFFDYDKDGDLDCFVMNENPLFGVDPINFNKVIAENEELLYKSSSHFYKNEGGKFVESTKEVGLLKPTFGLGLVVVDFNKDGFLDIYMANDYYVPDRMFVNDGEGQFNDEIKERTEQISFFGMGVDVADINNDMLEDIFVLDMASADHYRSKTLMASMNTQMFDILVEDLQYPYQYMFNSLQLNQGDESYRNIAHMTGMAKTDWSWAVLMVDYNNDPHKDIFVSNGYRKYALDNDVRSGVQIARRYFKQNVPIDVKERLYASMPSEPLPNYMYQNLGNLNFKEKIEDWGFAEASFSNGAAYADLDNDGDLELIVNNIDAPAFIYKNNSVELKTGNFLNIKTKADLGESFAKVTIRHNGKSQVYHCGRVRGYLSAVENLAHFGLGADQMVDTLLVEWTSGKVEERFNIKANQTLIIQESKAKNQGSKKQIGTDKMTTAFQKIPQADIGLSYQHQENDYDDFVVETLLPYRQSTLGPFMTKGDVNKDGKEDLWIGGAAGQAGALWLQTKNGFELQDIAAFEADKDFEDLEGAFFDYDADGDLDLYIVSGGNANEAGNALYKDRIYENKGKAKFERRPVKALESLSYSGKTVCPIDFDRDGRMDLFVGNRIVPQKYPEAAPSFLWKNEKGGGMIDVTKELIPDIERFGIINKAIASDFNKDGWMDLIVVSEWGIIGVFQNKEGKFENLSPDLGLEEQKGWWWTIVETDVNNDGLPDFVIGNVGLNTKYKTSPDKPLKIFADDFDDSGTWDVVLSYKYEGEYVPFRGRECSSGQMPFIAKKFPTYSSFASASITDVLGESIKTAYTQEVTTFASLLLLNKGDSQFEWSELPTAVQMAPVLCGISVDVNKDGFEDIVLAGNVYNTEVETPRWDSGVGKVLISNGKDGYSILPNQEAGLYLKGNIKDLKMMQLGKKKYLLATENNRTIRVYAIDR